MFASVLSANSFVESPALKDDVVFVGDDNLIYTPYKDKNNLTEEQQNELVAAYQSIVGAIDASFLSKDVLKYIEKHKAIPTYLAVTDLFDVSAVEERDSYTFQIGKEDMNKFFCVIHYNNGNWEVVDAKFNKDRTMVEVTVDTLSPFAFMYRTKEAVEKTKAIGTGVVVTAFMVTGIGAGAATISYLKKKRVEEQE